jgi:rod shape-determining protein MreD
MRGYIFSIALLIVLAVTESSLLPAALGANLRPGLILIVSAVWASMQGSDGFALALGGGLLLDLMSSVPLGLTSLSLLLGNVVASILNRAPIPSRLFHATTWVAIVTVVAHSVTLIGLAISGTQVNIVFATVNVILPLLLLNPLLAIPTYLLARLIQDQLRKEVLLTGSMKQ